MVMGIVLDPHPFVVMFLVSTVDASQQLLFKLVGELEAKRIVVGELLANITGIGPRRLGAGVGASAALLGPRRRGVVTVVVVVIVVAVVAGRER